jgi:uncharacterized protein
MAGLAYEGTPLPVNEYLVEAGSRIHGRGLFAIKTIPPDTQLIEYLGERITKAESLVRCEEENAYIFTLDDQYDLDGDMPWNPARWANHSCSPNCEAYDVEGQIWLFSKREIQAGEEITFNYGYDLEDYQEHPCACGSPACVGFMVAEEFFGVIQRRRDPGMTATGPLVSIGSGESVL